MRRRAETDDERAIDASVNDANDARARAFAFRSRFETSSRIPSSRPSSSRMLKRSSSNRDDALVARRLARVARALASACVERDFACRARAYDACAALARDVVEMKRERRAIDREAVKTFALATRCDAFALVDDVAAWRATRVGANDVDAIEAIERRVLAHMATMETTVGDVAFRDVDRAPYLIAVAALASAREFAPESGLDALAIANYRAMTASARLFNDVFFKAERAEGERKASVPATDEVLRAVAYACDGNVRALRVFNEHLNAPMGSAMKSTVDVSERMSLIDSLATTRAETLRELVRYVALSDEIDRMFDERAMVGASAMDEHPSSYSQARSFREAVEDLARIACSEMRAYTGRAASARCSEERLKLLLEIVEYFTADSNMYETMGTILAPALLEILLLETDKFTNYWAARELVVAPTRYRVGDGVEIPSGAVTAPSHSLSLFRIFGNIHDVDDDNWHNWLNPIVDELRRARIDANGGWTYKKILLNLQKLESKVLSLRSEENVEHPTEEEITAWKAFVSDTFLELSN